MHGNCDLEDMSKFGPKMPPPPTRNSIVSRDERAEECSRRRKNRFDVFGDKLEETQKECDLEVKRYNDKLKSDNIKNNLLDIINSISNEDKDRVILQLLTPEAIDQREKLREDFNN